MNIYKPDTLIALQKPFRADGRDMLSLTAIGGYSAKAPDALQPEMELLKNFLLEDPLATALDVGLPKLQGELLLYFDQIPGAYCTIQVDEESISLPVSQLDPAPGCGLLPDWPGFLQHCQEMKLDIVGKPEESMECPEGFDYSFLNVSANELRLDGFSSPGAVVGLKGYLPDTPIPDVRVMGLINILTQQGLESTLADFHIDTLWLFPQRDLFVVIWRSIVAVDKDAPIQDIVLIADHGTAPTDLAILFDEWSRNPGTTAFDETQNPALATIFAPDGKSPVSSTYLSTPLPDPFTSSPAAEDAVKHEFAKLAADLGVNPKGGLKLSLPKIKPKVPVAKLIPMLRANGINDPGLESELLRAAQGAAANRQKAALLENQIKMMLGG